MPATRDGKTWRSQFYYEDWQGIRHKKNKRGFKTKAEAVIKQVLLDFFDILIDVLQAVSILCF